MRAQRNRSRALLACAWLLGASVAAAAADAAALEQHALATARGRKIYLSGVPENGAPLLAEVGNAGMQVPAGLLKCANCHGRDGRGKAEGGVTPANIRWEELTKPAGGAGAAGRRRPAYTGKLLIRAVTTGIDAGGHRLATAMPRYQLTHEQAADLIAYLEVLGHEADPGVTETSLKVGVLLPPVSVHGGAQSIRVPLAAFAESVNAAGGLYGRRLQPVFMVLPDETEKRAGAIRSFLEHEQPFCLVASYTAGCEDELGEYLEENGLPLIGPISLYGLVDEARSQPVFHVVAGLAGQGEALASFAATLPGLPHAKAVIVRPADDVAMREVTAGLSKRLLEAGWSAPREVTPEEIAAAGDRAWSAGEQANAVFWFAPADGLPAFFRAAASAPPFLFAPSALAGGELLAAPAGFAGRVFCAFSSLPSDQSANGHKELQALIGEANAANGSLARPALASLKLLVHGVRQAGREVSRAKLVEILETLYSFDTEQIPPLTFTVNRHLGAGGAHVVAIDVEHKSFILPSTWVLFRP